MRPILLLCGLLLCACGGTSYKVAPTTTKVATRLGTAARSVSHARELTAQIDATTRKTASTARTTAEHIQAAIKANASHDAGGVSMELNAALVSNEMVQWILQQSLGNVSSLQNSLSLTEQDLTDATVELGAVNKTIEVMALQGAKDRAIVEEVNWGFRIGALIYFVKGLLAKGFFGILILGGVLIALLLLGGPFALFATRVIGIILGWIRSR